MNVLFLLTPKDKVEYLYGDFSIRQAMEKMEFHRYAMIPVIDKTTGVYLYSLSEGDILWHLKASKLSSDQWERTPISEVVRNREIPSINAMSDVESLYPLIAAQNYVPVVDDQQHFIGIVTRKAVLEKLLSTFRLGAAETK